jgi:dihydrofolate reductase
MRKLVVCNIMSLDGYDEGPGNNVMVLPMDASFDEYNLERIRAADAVLLGRTSYQAFSGFWPAMADNPDAPWLAELKQRSGREILTFASRTLWNHLLAAGLVDELHLVVGSTVLGGGTPIFGAPVAGLKLLHAHGFEGSDTVLLAYAAAAS